MEDNLILQVWNKGQAVLGYDSSKYRKDQCGAWMTFSEYGNRSSIYGWEIDHITPQPSAFNQTSAFTLQPSFILLPS